MGSRLLSLLRALISSLLPLAMGVGWLWYGLSSDVMPRCANQPIGPYSFHIMGAVFIAAGLGTFASKYMKFRARAQADDKAINAGGPTFDADGVTARNLASKQKSSDAL